MCDPGQSAPALSDVGRRRICCSLIIGIEMASDTSCSGPPPVDLVVGRHAVEGPDDHHAVSAHRFGLAAAAHYLARSFRAGADQHRPPGRRPVLPRSRRSAAARLGHLNQTRRCCLSGINARGMPSIDRKFDQGRRSALSSTFFPIELRLEQDGNTCRENFFIELPPEHWPSLCSLVNLLPGDEKSPTCGPLAHRSRLRFDGARSRRGGRDQSPRPAWRRPTLAVRQARSGAPRGPFASWALL